MLGLALDGTGLGDDQSPWGGELFYGESADLQRIGHLSQIALPGGDIAARDIWRIGAALLGRFDPAKALSHYQACDVDPAQLNYIIQTNQTVLTSSGGRWFDAVASILGIRQQVTFEGQAAMQLEQLAVRTGSLPSAQQLLTLDDKGILDLYPMVPSLLNMTSPQQAAARFHSELIDGLDRWIQWAASRHACQQVVLSGGCFQNRLLRDNLHSRLQSAGYQVYFPQQVPANDAGISLGQAWIARQLLSKSV